MNKKKIIILFYIFLAVSYTTAIIYLHYSIPPPQTLDQMHEATGEITFYKTVNVTKTKIFDTMTDVQHYPIILPYNVVSIRIINQSNNVIYAEEEVMEQFLITKLLVKHTFVPYDKQILEVMNGDAKGTIVTETFEGEGSHTTLNTNLKLHLSGKLKFLLNSKLKILPEMNRITDGFVEYTKGFDNPYKKTVDDLYREILHRPSDMQGLSYYATMLQNGKMTEDDIRKSLYNSDEGKLVLIHKNPDQLNPNTRNTIDSIYKEILNRTADSQGMSYYGSLLESDKITIEDIKKELLNSNEYKDMKK